MFTPLDILKKYFGYTHFKEPQEKIINALLSNKDTLAILPTGSGKSICYQIPALLHEGVCLVVSPLIALMQDQAEALKKRGIKSIVLSSSQNKNETITLFDNLQYGNFKFLFLSPEKLQSEFIQQKIRALNLNLIAIDEAHCISEWGHDFRPSYLKVSIVKKMHPSIPVIALTATATLAVSNDIIKQLEFSNYQLFKKPVARKNIAIRVFENEAIYKQLLVLLKDTKFPSIIYATTRKRTKDISFFLNQNNIKSSYYHGGLSLQEKQKASADWKNEKTLIMVATNAFGMGIDKDNVRHVIHVDLPFSIENYVQESGRAGRNGKKSYATIFVNKHNISQFKNAAMKSVVTIDFIKRVYMALNNYYQISYGELPKQQFVFNLTEFCNIYKIDTVQTFYVLQILERESILVFDNYMHRKSTLKFKVSSSKMLTYSNAINSELIRLIMRNYTGIFEQYTTINEGKLAERLRITSAQVKNQLLKIAKDGMAYYTYNKNTSRLLFLQAREDKYTLNRISRYISQQNELKINKMNAMLHFVSTKKECRAIVLAAYFDEKTNEPCGICDVCTRKNSVISPMDRKQISKRITRLLAQKQEFSTQEINTHLNLTSEISIPILRILLDDHKITLTSQNKFQIK